MTRDAVPHPLPDAVVEAAIEPGLDDSDDLPPQQCGRCRMMFNGDPTLDVRARNGWSLCPTCEAILLPVRARHANVIALHRRAPASDEG